MLGKGQGGGYPPEMSESLQSLSVPPLEVAEKKGLQLSVPLQAAPQPHNQPLLFSPASLQLAQLQAQLTLQRLKLAQGGNAATASSVLNQLLSNASMSQPLFNQLRTPSMVGSAPGAFPTGVMSFPSPNAAVGPLVGGGLNQNSGNVRLNPISGEYGKPSGSVFSCDTDRRFQTAAPVGAGDPQCTGITTQAKSNTGIHPNVFGHDVPATFPANEQKIHNSAARKEQWKGHNNSPAGKADLLSNPAAMWMAPGQPIQSRTELYNPEEPTSEPKLSCSTGISTFGSSGAAGMGGYPPLLGSEEPLSSGVRTLQPYQVNDYYDVTPTQLPHQCSICDKKVYNLKDWDQHVKGKLHLQNRTLYTVDCSAAASAAHYAVSRPSDGGLNLGGNHAVTCSAASQDVSSGANASYLPASAMRIYSKTDSGFPCQQSEPFAPSQASAGRVVHICNLPEGSCTENDVINLGLPFGKVTNYILMRSTHQAFLEMAYDEAAQAMVQYYQLTPAMINNQKLLIRMSKRYKELQLKKPGKDVLSVIQDITSQREREEMQELEHFMIERPRSRSPINHSLSPPSHSPSFASCGSAHSPPGALFRGPERGSNGFGPHRSSWAWPSHIRRSEEERDREYPWRNGDSMDDDLSNGRAVARRKPYQKHLDFASLRASDEQGVGEGMRESRDRHPRGSPQGFSSYRGMADHFYSEQMYKSEKSLRPSYPRHDMKTKRRDGGDYHARSRHPDFDLGEEPPCRAAEDKRSSSPGRRSKKSSRRRESAERHEKENASENNDSRSKEKSVSPQENAKTEKVSECDKDGDTKKDEERGEDTDEECWYPTNMEELVTVDEVGGEDDSIIEPDLPEIEDFASKKSGVEETVEKPSAPPSLEQQETLMQKPEQENSGEETESQTEACVKNTEGDDEATVSSPEDQKKEPESSELPLTHFPSEDFKAAVEMCLDDNKVPQTELQEDPPEILLCSPEDSQNQEEEHVVEIINNNDQPTAESLKKEIEVPFSSAAQDKAVSEHSIPLGVEFIVPSTGFYCKLCELFYTSESTAKTTHCRSTVHYKNLQKYLSQLAEDSLSSVLN
ncbi:hypothetical protein OJAV_G00000750 [Oryzias javanicus]|uniref:Matrin-type domain-containing protein n=1 Tax=Oryzias javanicus TaxID=123683 RepID=A0A437DKL6_ORYJA|nr:hypothetical protein OJAV_G00000750 [Oryzias javanicus]